MLNTGLHIAVDEERLKAIEEKIAKILDMLEAKSLTDEARTIGDWIEESRVIKLTNLSKTTLYNLKKKGQLSCSSLVEGKGRWYRLSEIEALLYERQEYGK